MRSPSDPPDPESQGQTARAKPGPSRRDDRLKAALKANMARRKAQAKARSTEDVRGETEDRG